MAGTYLREAKRRFDEGRQAPAMTWGGDVGAAC